MQSIVRLFLLVAGTICLLTPLAMWLAAGSMERWSTADLVQVGFLSLILYRLEPK
jgi:hypothetical protein